DIALRLSGWLKVTTPTPSPAWVIRILPSAKAMESPAAIGMAFPAHWRRAAAFGTRQDQSRQNRAAISYDGRDEKGKTARLSPSGDKGRIIRPRRSVIALNRRYT